MAEIIRPVAVTEDILVSTTAVAADADWDSGVSYAAAARATHATRRWESLQAANLDHEPGAAGSADWWTDMGASNPFAMFDKTVNSQSTAGDELIVEIRDEANPIDMVLMQNLAAVEVEGTLTDETEGVVWNETIDLAAGAIIDNWLTYFTEPFNFSTEALFADLPALYVGATLKFEIRNPDGVAACGLCLPGLSMELGGTQWGVETGIDSYARKTEDAWGGLVVQDGPYNKRARYSIWCARDRVGHLQDTLAAFRAKPMAVIGSRDDRATWVYGFFGSLNFVIGFPDLANLDLQMKGLV